jgi:hypothetical protein
MTGSSLEPNAIIELARTVLLLLLAFLYGGSLAGRMPASVRIEYNVILSEEANALQYVGPCKNLLRSLAICETLGIEASQTATTMERL